MAFVSGVKPVKYDCCINSCMCFSEHYAKLECYLYCQEKRFMEVTQKDGSKKLKPQRRYQYIPLIPRLVALYSNAEYSAKLQYRDNFISDPSNVTDIFNGSHYQHLRKTFVTINGKQLGHHYFSDQCDIVLGASFDGFSPFKRQKFASWPVLIINYDLLPEERFKIENLLCIHWRNSRSKSDERL